MGSRAVFLDRDGTINEIVYYEKTAKPVLIVPDLLTAARVIEREVRNDIHGDLGDRVRVS